VKVYIVRRLLALIPVALVVATVSFVLIHLAPGDPASVIAGPDASREDVTRIERQLGLDAPLPVQLGRWYVQLAQGNLGQSIFLRKPVTEAILDRVEPTLLLTLFAIVVASLIGVPAGVISARYHNSATDQVFMALALGIYVIASRVEERSTMRATLRALDDYQLDNEREKDLLDPLGERVVGPVLKAVLNIGRRFWPTGYAENAALARGFLAPGMAMVTKPFAVDALASRIREMLMG